MYSCASRTNSLSDDERYIYVHIKILIQALLEIHCRNQQEQH